MATGADVFGIVAGIISLLALIGGVLRTFLPSVRMRALDDILEETEKVLQSATEAGFFLDSPFLDKAYERLTVLRVECSQFRVRVACATSRLEEYRELCMGLSTSIGYCTGQAKGLRAIVVSESEAERQRIYHASLQREQLVTSVDRPVMSITKEEQNPCVRSPSALCSIRDGFASTEQDTGVVADLLARPASCPPKITTTIIRHPNPPPSYKEVPSRSGSMDDGKPLDCEDGTDCSFATTDTSVTGFVYDDWMRDSASRPISTHTRGTRLSSVSRCVVV